MDGIGGYRLKRIPDYMDNKTFFMGILSILNTLSILSILSILPRYPNFSRCPRLPRYSTCAEKIRLTAYLYAGYVSFLFNLITKFLRVLNVKNGNYSSQNSLINADNGYDKITYHNHRIKKHQKSHLKRKLQIVNDLKRWLENVDNFSLV